MKMIYLMVSVTFKVWLWLKFTINHKFEPLFLKHNGFMVINLVKQQCILCQNPLRPIISSVQTKWISLDLREFWLEYA